MSKLVGEYRAINVIPKDETATLTPAENGVIEADTDGIYLYLPTYVGNEGLIYLIKVSAAFSAGVVVTGASGDGGLIDGAVDKISTAIYDALEVICDGEAWHITSKVGTWN